MGDWSLLVSGILAFSILAVLADNGVASRNRWAASPVESRRVARSSDGTESPGANDPAPSPSRESEAADCVGAAVAYPAGRAPGSICRANLHHPATRTEFKASGVSLEATASSVRRRTNPSPP